MCLHRERRHADPLPGLGRPRRPRTQTTLARGGEARGRRRGSPPRLLREPVRFTCDDACDPMLGQVCGSSQLDTPTLLDSAAGAKDARPLPGARGPWAVHLAAAQRQWGRDRGAIMSFRRLTGEDDSSRFSGSRPDPPPLPPTAEARLESVVGARPAGSPQTGGAVRPASACSRGPKQWPLAQRAPSSAAASEPEAAPVAWRGHGAGQLRARV